MKILIYTARTDEREGLLKLAAEYGHEITMVGDNLMPETAYLAEGYEGVALFVNDNANKETIETLASYGVKYIATRAAGYNNIDLETCKRLGIKVANVPGYSPNSVSEITVGLTLSMTRKINTVITKSRVQDFGLEGLIGTEIRNLTVGVIGTGKIGFNVIKAFHGFGCKIIANDVYENDLVKEYAEYKSLDELYAESDIVTLHCPLLADNYHMINDEVIGKMKDNVIIINVARGGLVDAEALIRGLKSGKIQGLALDTYENESGIFHFNYMNKVIEDDTLVKLLQYPNVIITPHYAFYTDESVRNITNTTLLNFQEFELTGSADNQLA